MASCEAPSLPTTPRGRHVSIRHRSRALPAFRARLLANVGTVPLGGADAPATPATPSASSSSAPSTEYMQRWERWRAMPGLHQQANALAREPLASESQPGPPPSRGGAAGASPSPAQHDRTAAQYSEMWGRWRAIPGIQERIDALLPSPAPEHRVQQPSPAAASFIERLLGSDGSDHPIVPALSAPALAVLRARHAVGGRGVGLKAGTHCAICVQEMCARREEVVALPCGGHHAFHWNCIQPWLARTRTCPQCRDEIRINKGQGAPKQAPVPKQQPPLVSETRVRVSLATGDVHQIRHASADSTS